MQETKYGTVPTDEILKDGILHGFEIMCIVHESIVAMVYHLFSIYVNVYYLILKYGILYGFERMCIVHESIVVMVHHFFFIYIMYII